MGKKLIIKGLSYTSPEQEQEQVVWVDVVSAARASNADNYTTNWAWMAEGTKWDGGGWISMPPVPVDSTMRIEGTAVGYDGMAHDESSYVRIFPVVFLDENQAFISSPEPERTDFEDGKQKGYDCTGLTIPANARYVTLQGHYNQNGWNYISQHTITIKRPEVVTV